jgi:hypothetical protein
MGFELNSDGLKQLQRELEEKFSSAGSAPPIIL